MKQWLILFNIILLVTSISCAENYPYPKEEPPFSLKLVLHTKEHSKDSNWQDIELTFNNNDVEYNIRYGGYRPAPKNPTHIEAQLKEQDIIKVLNFIRKREMLQSVTEKKPTDQLGQEVRFDLTLKLGEESYQSHIEGMTYIMGRKGMGNLDHIKYTKTVMSFHSMIRSMLRNY